jgi:secondary thiamine-phosphate synthase enzyme
MKTIHIKTKGWTDIVDITPQVQKEIEKEKINNGLVHLFLIGSTASLTTIEDDENLFVDLKEILEKIAPYKKDWQHHKTWGDDNGAAHLRASFFGPSLTIPVVNGKLFLGTWQRIVLVDFDTQPREREVVISFVPNNFRI